MSEKFPRPWYSRTNSRARRGASDALILRKYPFIFYAQTIDPALALPFARQFDQIIIDTFSKLVDIAPDEFDENALRQMQLSLKEGGCGFHTHSPLDLRKFYVASALLASPCVEAATGLAVGTQLGGELAVQPPSERIISESVHLLERAGVPAPDFEYAGPVEADAYLTAAAKRFGELQRSALLARFAEANDAESQVPRPTGSHMYQRGRAGLRKHAGACG